MMLPRLTTATTATSRTLGTCTRRWQCQTRALSASPALLLLAQRRRQQQPQQQQLGLRPLSSTPDLAASDASKARAEAPAWAKRLLPRRLLWVHPYLSLARVDKPIGTWLLFWPGAWALSMAAYASHASPVTLAWYTAVFGAGALVMRGAGCTINDLWDRRIDVLVERTRQRPLASGAVTPLRAMSFLGLQLSVGLACLTQLNMYSICLGAASLGVVVLYPLAKRVTYWPQFVLGLAFNWGALLGSSTVLGYCDWTVALPLYIGSIGWTIVYDTIYAHQDKVDDVAAGVKSTALLFGERTRPILSAFATSFVGLLAYAGMMNAHGVPFYAVSVAGAAAHLVWQLKNVDLDSTPSCWQMFRANRDLGAIVWSGITLDYALQYLAL